MNISRKRLNTQTEPVHATRRRLNSDSIDNINAGPILVDQLSEDLESVPLGISEAAHKRMDDIVFQQFGRDLKQDALPHLLFLLSIVQNSNGLLDSRYTQPEEVWALHRAYPKLEEKLMEAWKAGSFRTIRNLSTILP